MLGTAIFISFVAVGAALLLATWRLLRGPDLPDRVLALDTLYISAIALLVLSGIAWRTQVYFEAALLIALIGFAGTVALALYIARGDVMH
jgi:multicomponent K+:H+ antiporter subunit F